MSIFHTIPNKTRIRELVLNSAVDYFEQKDIDFSLNDISIPDKIPLKLFPKTNFVFREAAIVLSGIDPRNSYQVNNLFEETELSYFSGVFMFVAIYVVHRLVFLLFLPFNTLYALDTLLLNSDFEKRLHLVRDCYMITQEGVFLYRFELPEFNYPSLIGLWNTKLYEKHQAFAEFYSWKVTTLIGINTDEYYTKNGLCSFSLNHVQCFHKKETFLLLREQKELWEEKNRKELFISQSHQI
eukprot:snap_masked-scaffold_27-processed-gene-4.23-mRNA-1 protein AED:1.00 eAED:1.00 QI:0/0/0/0/1/1/2/0/239